MLRHLDLFSGLGGFSLGLEATGGFETETSFALQINIVSLMDCNFALAC